MKLLEREFHAHVAVRLQFWWMSSFPVLVYPCLDHAGSFEKIGQKKSFGVTILHVISPVKPVVNVQCQVI